MKLLTTKTVLADMLQTIKHGIATRSSLPILSQVLLRAEADMLTGMTTSLDLAIQSSVPTTVEEEGSTTLPARQLDAIARNLPDGEVSLTCEKQRTSIDCKDVHYKLAGMDAAEFPTWPEHRGQLEFCVPVAVLRQVLIQTSFAAATDSSRYMLNGILLQTTGKDTQLTVVATDGRRLARSIVSLAAESSEVSCVLPTATVQLLSPILAKYGDSDTDVLFSVSPTTIQIMLDATRIYSKALEGIYPNYKRGIPDMPEHNVTVNRAMLAHALKRVALICSDKTNCARLTCSKNQLLVSSISAVAGEAHETIAAQHEGEPVSVALSIAYMLDVLQSSQIEEIVLGITGPGDPVVIRSDADNIAVIMPVFI